MNVLDYYRQLCNIFITFDMVKYSELFRILKKDGWYIVRQKGSHVLMQHRMRKGQLSVPFHAGKEVKKGLLRSILKMAGIKSDNP
jgi:predicted RNA binding protein YcfA (HicA-like mRNA interferase family)